MRRFRTIAELALIVAVLFSQPGSVSYGSAQGSITFGPSTVDNFFPRRITFYVTVTSVDYDIVEAEIFYARRNQISSQSMRRVELDIEVGKKVVLEYTWDTSGLTVPPSLPIAFYWRVTDSSGNVAQSEETVIGYDDTRFDWKVRANPYIAIWWHGKTAGFGQRVYNIAVEAVEEQSKFFNATLAYQMRIIIYNNHDEFNAWRNVPSEWVGGQAFPDYGITAQIVEGSVPDDYWLRSVIPHEISHLYYAQVTYNPMVSPPYWLDEGVAQYNEHRDYGYQLSSVWNAATKGELIPLSSLEDGFGSFNEDRVFLAYEEALSAVLYMVEEFGEHSVANLLAAYREGLSNDEAFLRAFGSTVSEFEANWASWLGVPEGSYVTPTAWPMPTFRPSPTIMTFATKEPSPPTVTPSPTTTQEPQPTSAPTPTPEPEKPRKFCPSMLLPLPVIFLALSKPIRRKRNEKTARSAARR